MEETVFVLLRWSEFQGNAEPDDVRVYSVHRSFEEVEAKLDRIRRANPQYELRQLSDHFWRIGPDEDEGFFGNRPVYLKLVEKAF